MKYLKIAVIGLVSVVLVGLVYFVFRTPSATESEAMEEASAFATSMETVIINKFGLIGNDTGIGNVTTTGCDSNKRRAPEIEGGASMRARLDSSDLVEFYDLVNDFLVSEGFERQGYAASEFPEQLRELVESDEEDSMFAYYRNEDTDMRIRIAFELAEYPVYVHVNTGCYRNLDYED